MEMFVCRSSEDEVNCRWKRNNVRLDVGLEDGIVGVIVVVTGDSDIQAMVDSVGRGADGVDAEILREEMLFHEW